MKPDTNRTRMHKLGLMAHAAEYNWLTSLIITYQTSRTSAVSYAHRIAGRGGETIFISAPLFLSRLVFVTIANFFLLPYR